MACETGLAFQILFHDASHQRAWPGTQYRAHVSMHSCVQHCFQSALSGGYSGWVHCGIRLAVSGVSCIRLAMSDVLCVSGIALALSDACQVGMGRCNIFVRSLFHLAAYKKVMCGQIQ